MQNMSNMAAMIVLWASAASCVLARNAAIVPTTSLSREPSRPMRNYAFAFSPAINELLAEVHCPTSKNCPTSKLL